MLRTESHSSIIRMLLNPPLCETPMPRMLIALLILSVACTAQESGREPSPTIPVNPQWASVALWDDGNAEVARYDAKRTVYGKTRSYERVMITVKEAFNAEYNVKTDDYNRDDLFTVMKVNLFARIMTDAYPYHYLTSLFFERTEPGVMHKLTNGSQEWCGNTMKGFYRTDTGMVVRYDSYWDGEGAGQRTLRPDPVFEDQLFYTLRALQFEDGLEFAVDVYPTVVTSRVGPLEPFAARFVVHNDALDLTGEFSKGASLPCWRVDMEREDGATASWWIGQDAPNLLLKFRHSDGRSMVLTSAVRDAYWEHE